MKRKLLAALFLPVLVISVFSLNGWRVVDAGISDCDLLYNSRPITEELRFDNNLQLYGYGADDEGTRILYIQSRDNGSNECDWPGGFFWLEKPAISANDEEYIFRSGPDARFYIEQGYENGSAVYVANGGPSSHSSATSVQISSSERASAYFQSSNTPDPPSQDSGTIDAIENEGGVIDSDSTASDSEEEETCEDVTGAWSWMICGLLRVTSNGLNAADDILNTMLRTPDEYIVSDAAEAAWVNFRNLAYILLVPALLIMVIGTALGFDFVSAYTVKKALPRMIAATIFIAFSYEIASFIISAVNTIGFGVQGFLAGAAGQDEFNLANNFPAPGGGPITLSWIGLGAGIGGGIGYIAGGGFFVFLGFLIAAILALIGVLLLLGFRQIGIMVLAILAPLAIIAWIFPGNTKLWGLWRTTFLKLLLLYPIIMLAIGGGKLFASVIAGIDSGADLSASRGIANKLFILVAYIGPYFLIPRLFKTAGGAFANLAGMVNDREKGLIDRSKNWGKGRKQTSSLGQAREAKKKEKIESRGRSANRLRHARSQFKQGDRSAAKQTLMDDLKQTYTPSGRRETREANDALLEAEVAKEGNAVRSGYAQKQASDIKSQAEIFRASAEIQNGIQSEMAKGENSYQARKNALNNFTDQLSAKMLSGQATDAEVTGGIAALATQRASSQLNTLQERIADAPASDPNAELAAQQFAGSYGNDAAYGAIQKVNPAITKIGLSAGMGSGNLKIARGEALKNEQVEKLVGMGDSGWEDLALYAASGRDPSFTIQSVAERYEQIYKMGGEAAASLAMPGPSGGATPNHVDQLRAELQSRNILTP